MNNNTTTTMNATINNTTMKEVETMKNITFTINRAEMITNLHDGNYITNEMLRDIVEQETNVRPGKKTNRTTLLNTLKDICRGATAKNEAVVTPSGDFGGDNYYPELQQEQAQETPVQQEPTTKEVMQTKILDAIRRAMFDATYHNAPVKYIKNQALYTIIKYNLPKELQTEANIDKVIKGMFKQRILSPINNKNFCCVLL